MPGANARMRRERVLSERARACLCVPVCICVSVSECVSVCVCA